MRSLVVVACFFAVLALVVVDAASTHGVNRLRLRTGGYDGALQPLNHDSSDSPRVMVEAQAESQSSAGVAIHHSTVGAVCFAKNGVSGFVCTLEVVRKSLAAIQDVTSALYDGQRKRLKENADAVLASKPAPHADTDLTQGELEAFIVHLESTLRGHTPAPHTGRVILSETLVSKKPDVYTQAYGASDFTYTYGTHGELVSVAGNVVRGSGTDARVLIWIQAVHLAQFNTIKPPRIEQGHIVAASLGGSNTDFHNFFAQTGNSNRGTYYDAEQVALGLVNSQKKAEGCVRIHITYQYNAHNYLIASNGMYVVEKNDRDVCFGGAVSKVDNWVQATSKAWDNRPAAVDVTIPTVAEPGQTVQIDFTPSTTFNTGDFSLTLTTSTGESKKLDWKGGNAGKQSYSVTAPASPQKFTVSYIVSGAGAVFFDSPSPSDLAMASLQIINSQNPITGPVALYPGNLKKFSAQLYLPPGSIAHNQVVLQKKALQVTITPDSGILVAAGKGVAASSVTLTFTDTLPAIDKKTFLSTLQFSLTAPTTASTIKLTYTLGGAAASYFIVPSNSVLIVPAIHITSNNGLLSAAPGATLSLLMKPDLPDVATDVEVTITASAGTVSPSKVKFTASTAKSGANFNFVAPSSAATVHISYSVAAVLANEPVRYAKPTDTTIVVA